MKRILFLCCSLFIGVSTTNAQTPTTIFSEDFESGIPGTWILQTDPSSNGWQPGTNGSLSSTNWTIPAPASGTGIAAVNDDACGVSCDSYDWLISPEFNATGYDSVRIMFKSYVSKVGTEVAFAGYNKDGSTTWNGANLPASTTGWNSWYLTVQAANLTSTFRVGFNYDDAFEFGYGFAIDDVVVVGYSSSGAVTNDDCATATVLTPTSSCTSGVSGSVIGATGSGLPASCATGADPSTDVWYSFQATTENVSVLALSNSATQANGFDIAIELYEGSCGSLSFLGCADQDDITAAGATGLENLNIGDLTIGNTYYIRVYNYFGTTAIDGSFVICVEEIDCTLSQPTGSVVENETCGGNTNGTCATGMNITCGDEVWGSYNAAAGTRDLDYYKFTINSPTTVNISLETEFPGIVVLFNAASCASPVQLAGSYVDACDLTTVTYNITAAGTYAILVTPNSFYSPSCSGSSDYILTYEANTTAPVISAGGSTTFCIPGSVNLSSTGTGTFVWNNGGSPIGGANASTYSATGTGSYSVELTDGNGCKSTSNTISVTANPQPSAPTITPGGATTFCSGGSVVLTSSSASGNTWSTGATTQSITVSASGTYSVTTTVAGCTSPSSTGVTVTVNPAPSAPTITPGGATTFCSGGSVVLTSSSASGNTWSTGATTQSITVSASGTYSVTTTAAGCTSPSSAGTTVTVNPLDDATFTYPTNTICDASPNQTPTVSVGGTFSSTAGLVFANTSTGEINVAASTAGTYTVTYTTSGSCPNSSSQTIVITGNPDATFTYAQSSYCVNESNPSPLFGSGASAGVFSSTSGLSINSTTGLIDLATSTPGTYTVTNFIAANGSCTSSTETFGVTIHAAPTVTFSALSDICENASDYTLVEGAPTGGTYSGNGVSSGVFSPSTAGAGSETLTYTYTDGNNCTVSATQSITVNATPTVTFSALSDVCVYNSSMALTGGSPSGGTYSGPGVTAGNFDPATAGSGTHTITYSYTDGNGCDGSATSTITVDACASIEEAVNFGLEIYPNPANDIISIKTGNNVTFFMVSEDGKVVYPESSLDMDTQTKLNVSHLSRGIYFLHFNNEQGNLVQKVVLK